LKPVERLRNQSERQARGNLHSVLAGKELSGTLT
jgi:hypothetical protein